MPVWVVLGSMPMTDNEAKRAKTAARRQFLRAAAYVAPAIASTVLISSRSAAPNPSCSPSTVCAPLGPCVPSQPCNPDNPCRPGH